MGSLCARQQSATAPPAERASLGTRLSETSQYRGIRLMIRHLIPLLFASSIQPFIGKTAEPLGGYFYDMVFEPVFNHVIKQRQTYFDS